jgi:hypothetical protein
MAMFTAELDTVGHQVLFSFLMTEVETVGQALQAG